MAVPRARMLDLMKAQCRIFSSVYNPEGLRIGTKILRQRLRGPSFAAYYPARPVTWSQVRKSYLSMGNIVEDEDEEDRLIKLEELRQRGKGQWQHRRGVSSAVGRKR